MQNDHRNLAFPVDREMRACPLSLPAFKASNTRHLRPLVWVVSHWQLHTGDRSYTVVTLTLTAQKPKSTSGHPGHSKDKPCLGIMHKKVTIPAYG